MARKKHLKGISKEEMEFIDQKLSFNNNSPEYTFEQEKKINVYGFKLDVKCKNEKQKDYYNNLRDISKKVNICNAPAGVGKSFLALSAALFCLKNGIVNDITIIVPTVEASESCKIGLLPGNIDEKIQPYKVATQSTLEKILKLSGNIDYKSLADYFIFHNMIKFELLSFARGRNYDNTFLILDEAENLSKKECLLLMTRIGEGNSKIALIGDEQQCDRKDLRKDKDCGLTYAIEKLEGMEEVTINNFSNEDIVRNEFLKKLLDAWNG